MKDKHNLSWKGINNHHVKTWLKCNNRAGNKKWKIIIEHAVIQKN